MKPPFTYYGGKTQTAGKIVALLGPHSHYVEPFAGSLAVLLAKPQSAMETVNDLSRDLMTFWRVLRDRPDDLERACALTPHSRADYLDAYEDSADELEQARRVWVRITQGRTGVLDDLGWRSNAFATEGGWSTIKYQSSYLARMPSVAARLRGVSLECKPALEIIGTYGKHADALIYADPPYERSTRTGTHGLHYAVEMADETAHADLAKALHEARAAVVLSGYDSPLYGDLYGDWHRTGIETWTGNGTGDKSRTEVLWSNRPFPVAAPTLFDEVAI